MVDEKRNRIGYWILFILYPFGSLVLNIWSNNRKSVYILLVVAYCGYLGFNLVIGGDYGGADSAHYADQLKDFYQENVSFSEVSRKFYNTGDGIDIYQPLVTYGVSLFTDNARILFAIFSIIFGFFWIKSYEILVSHIPGNISLLITVMLIVYLTINPIWNVNGVRMWTAAHVFGYGVLSYYLEKNKAGVMYLFLSSVVHWSFIILVILWLLSIFLKWMPVALFLGMYFISGFIAELDVEAVRENLGVIPELFSDRTEGYVSEAYVEKVNEVDFSWHVELFSFISKWITICFVGLVSIFYYGRNTLNSESTSLLKFGLLISSFAFLASQLPSGARYISVSNLILYPVFILFLNNIISNKIISSTSLTKILILPLGYLIFFKVWSGLGLLGYNVVFGNILTSVLDYNSESLLLWVKSVL